MKRFFFMLVILSSCNHIDYVATHEYKEKWVYDKEKGPIQTLQGQSKYEWEIGVAKKPKQTSQPTHDDKKRKL